jgi:phospholipase C
MKKIVFLALLVLALSTQVQARQTTKQDIDHIIVLYFENRSFDNIFRGFEGANTSDKPTKPYNKQIDENGSVYQTLPMSESSIKLGIPTNLQNEPFLIDRYISQNQTMPDLIHRYYQAISQINSGRNDRFVQISDAKGLSMGYHDMRESHIWKFAKQYTLCDNFFTGAFGGSFLNHQWLIAARTPEYFDANETNFGRYILNKHGDTLKDGVLTRDGYAVNTVQPFSPPFDDKFKDTSKRLPAQTYDTIGDRLSAKNISWAWYSGGYNEAMSANAKAVDYQFHHSPFSYFAKYAIGTVGRAHLKDEDDFFEALEKSKLPSVVFFKPSAADNQHPGYASIKSADNKLYQIVTAIKANKKLWRKSIIIVTYDENGGLWDHVSPPKGDIWGPGVRIPAIVISPMTKKSYIDHTQYDTTSILKLIEWRFGLKPLSDRDKNVNNLNKCLK